MTASHAVINFRDLSSADSQKTLLRPGVVFRSAEVGAKGADAGSPLLSDNITAVIDLRVRGERESIPDVLPSATQLVVADVLADAPDASAAKVGVYLKHPEQLKAAFDKQFEGMDPASLASFASNTLADTYASFSSLPSALSGFSTFIHQVLKQSKQSDGAVLFHCTAGKDRTGWAAAIVLNTLGVSHDDILADYLLSNENILPAYEPLFAQYEKVGGNASHIRPLFEVREEYLQAAFDAVEKNFGSFERYLAEGLSFDLDAQDELRNNLSV